MSVPVVALVLDREARARVRTALRSVVEPTFCEHVHEVAARLRETPVALVIVEFRDRAGLSTAPLAQAIRRGFPSIPIVAYGALAGAAPADILELGKAGVDQLIIRGFNDYELAFRTALTSATGRCTTDAVMRTLAPELPPSVQPLFGYCLDHAGEALTVADVARALDVHNKSLATRLRQVGLPSANLVISWCRLFRAAHLLEDPKRSVEQVALTLGYPSGTALRNMLKRYLGLRPSEVRQNGGLACALHEFRRAVRALRSRTCPRPPSGVHDASKR